jgi:DnaJ-class molecular chaperone
MTNCLKPAELAQEWIGCWDCGGEGEHNHYDEDPLWYGTYMEAWEPCETCNGKGGWYGDVDDA